MHRWSSSSQGTDGRWGEGRTDKKDCIIRVPESSLLVAAMAVHVACCLTLHDT